QSQYKVMFRKSRSLLTGIDPRSMTPEKLRKLLDEMNRMGRRPGSGGGGGGGWGQEGVEGGEALGGGQREKGMEAMERALEKMRAQEDRERGGKGLQSGRTGRDREREGGRGGRPGEDDPDFGEGQGSLPGKGTNPGWRGDPTNRLGQNPFDIGV